jgi:hypothetical protein
MNRESFSFTTGSSAPVKNSLWLQPLDLGTPLVSVQLFDNYETWL